MDYRVLVNLRQVRRVGTQRGFSPHGKREYASPGLGEAFPTWGLGSGLIGRKEDSQMAIESHLAELERRHRALEQELSEALSHPSIDGLKIAELKRRKLYVKDEITRLRQDAVVH